MTPVDRDTQLGALWRDGLAFADAAERAGLAAPVPTCPGWTVADLVWHVGEVHVFWRSVVAEGWADPSPYVEPERPLGDELVPWFRESVQRTVEVLSGADPGEPVWTWAPRGGTAAWVLRRMAHETAVHRWDVDPAPIDTELAADGVSEFLEHFTDTAAEGAAPMGGTVHLRATDVDVDWLVAEPEPGGRLQVSPGHGPGDAEVWATASDLLLLLWRRVGLDDAGRFQITGEPEVARRLVARSRLD